MGFSVCICQEQQSAEQKETALVRTPSLLEICGHSYYFGGFLVGPQVTDTLLMFVDCTRWPEKQLLAFFQFNSHNFGSLC